jgi:hypothetical protein
MMLFLSENLQIYKNIHAQIDIEFRQIDNEGNCKWCDKKLTARLTMKVSQIENLTSD